MTPPQGIKGRQILKLLLNHLQTGVEDDQTFKIAELTSLKCRQTGHSDDEARLRSYLSTWDNLIYGIKRKIDDGVLLAVFIENVRHLRCMRPDIERWDRDETVRSFPWLYKACQDCVERWQKRQNTLQMYQTFHEQRSGRARTLVKGIGILELLGLFEDTTHSRGKATRALQGPLGPEGMGNPTGSQDHLRPEEAVRETELLLEEAVRGTSAHRLPSRREDSPPAGPADRVCWEYTKTGKCQYGRECRFEHDKSDTATTGCMASAQLSRASTCIRSHHRVRSLSRLVLLLVRLLRMKRGIPLGRPRPVLPIGRRGVSTAPLKD